MTEPRSIDRSQVIAEAYPGAANDIERMIQQGGGLVCEQHPDREWPHDDCAGPGMLRSDLDRDFEAYKGTAAYQLAALGTAWRDFKDAVRETVYDSLPAPLRERVDAVSARLDT